MYKLEKGVQNVLLVEDNTLTMLLLEAELQKHGFKIRKAPDGEAGWKVCQEQHFDLLIIDLLMPVKLRFMSLALTVKSRRFESNQDPAKGIAASAD